ncbi:adenylate/guanylate cyclase domain-containing protein [uncultured Alsobacter sp.]|uniref:adenylate/guanylate cyclase domain-containing protein n=1 Tax=uncultured Alsobacter sp. TaxID=1748258 RepID=UPI0025E3E647|nr:adenylate/guanylate cyclase domain-containing protein [uncultured Alsobacter sp.]
MISTRRLAAILAADVVGFSGLMEKDEEGTVRRVQALRNDLIDPGLAKHRGRLVKTTGDGFLAEFASPIAAVAFAIDLQRSLTEDADGLRMRVGINLGDIIVEEDGDVYGEGVNVAARLEALCEPGSVLVSSKIYEEVEGKVSASFEDQGEKQVKNISKLVRVFAVRGPGEFPGRSLDPRAPPRRSLPGWLVASGAGLAVAVVALGAWAWWSRSAPAVQPAMVAATAGPATTPPLSPAADGAFDGTWRLTVTCAAVESPRSAGYVLRLVTTVSGGRLQGGLGTPGQPGSFQIEGVIAPGGAARFTARGVVNNPNVAFGASVGSLYEYTAEGTFGDRSGRARRVQLRPCDLAFER